MLRRTISAVAAIALIAAVFPTEGVAQVAPPLAYRFEVAMVRVWIWNRAVLRNDPVELRSFRGAGIKDGDFGAPPIRVRPGQTLRVRLANRLPACMAEENKAGSCRNDTELHGLWVSPSGNSDNIMISIPPGESFIMNSESQKIIRRGHSGTTRTNGSGMYQLGSGMAGALIVEGSRLPTAERPGDIDILLKDDRGRSIPERILVLKHPLCLRIRRGRLSTDGVGQPGDTHPAISLRAGLSRAGRTVHPICPAGRFGPGGGRFYALNGKVQPTLSGAVAGRFERWRIVTTGFHGVIRLGLRRLASDPPDV